MATGIVLAGGTSRRMPGDKAFMEVCGRPVIDIELDVLLPLFDEVLIVANAARLERLARFARRGVRVVEESVQGQGPLGGIASGLMLTGSDENFVAACDMPFIRREAVELMMDGLAGYEVAVPDTPAGLEPLFAAYRRQCLPKALSQIEDGNLKVTDFYRLLEVHLVPWEELLAIDPSGRMLLNINSPADMQRAARVGEELP